MEGKITYVYSIQSNFSGKKEIPATSIAFFNPKKEQFEQVSTKSETIEVLESAISATTPSNSIELARPTTTEKTAENETMQLLKKPLFWSVSVPLVIALLVGFIQFRKKKETPTAIVVENKPDIVAIEKPEIDFFDEAEKAFAAQQENAYYTNIENGMIAALVTILSLKNDVQPSKQLVIQAMQDQAISDEIQQKIKALFEACTAAKYGFEKRELENTQLLVEAKEVTLQLGA